MSAVEPYDGCEPLTCKQPWASDRVVMCGQAPSSRGSHDPKHALTGAPMRRLFKHAGIGLMEYVRTFERHNLVPVWKGYNRAGESGSGSRFAAKDAEVGARVLADRLAGGRRLVCWGPAVARAFVGDWVEHMDPLRWYTREVAGLDNSYDVPVAILPHPSGLNRWWNVRANADAAGEFIRALVRDVHTARAAHEGRRLATQQGSAS